MLDRREPVGGLLRLWRGRRRLRQVDLSCDAGISTRHLSFVETGRAHPSSEMLLHLSEQLDVPVRERNVLLVAAGYAPIFPERPLTDPALTAARDRSRAGAPEAIPRLRARPAMARRRQQRGAAGTVRRGRRRSLGAATECDAA